MSIHHAPIPDLIGTLGSGENKTFAVCAYVTPFKSCLQEAADDGIISGNPTARLKIPKPLRGAGGGNLAGSTTEEIPKLLTLAAAVGVADVCHNERANLR
jgi:hypothetical protein